MATAARCGVTCGVGIVLVAVVLASGIPAGAHHTIAELYDQNRTITIQGKVGRLFYGDPHALVHLVVVGEQSSTRTWAVELDDTAKLSQQGLSRETLQPGDRITVCGNPGRDPGAYRVLMLTLERPSDGLSVTRSSANHNLGPPAPRCSRS